MLHVSMLSVALNSCYMNKTLVNTLLGTAEHSSPLQFAYRRNRSTADVISMALNPSLKQGSGI